MRLPRRGSVAVTLRSGWNHDASFPKSRGWGGAAPIPPGGTTDPHDRAQYDRQDGAEYTEADGVVQPPHQHIGHPLAAILVKAEQELRDFSPVPVVIEADFDPVKNEDTYDQE